MSTPIDPSLLLGKEVLIRKIEFSLFDRQPFHYSVEFRMTLDDGRVLNSKRYYIRSDFSTVFDCVWKDAKEELLAAVKGEEWNK
jgi:hypothetical protein